MKKLTIGNKISLGVMAFILCVVIAFNITCGILFEMISGFFHGSGIEFTGEATQEALALSDDLCKDMVGEGIVLLENKDETLPLTKSDLAQVNVFGWRAINNGWIGGASGSVNANNNSTREKVVTLLEAMEESGFEYNQSLISMYESFCNVGDGKALNDGEKFFTLKEPTADYYTDTLIAEAKDFSDIAFVVFGRQGGEGEDLTLNKQLKYNLATDTTRSYLDISTEEEAMLNIVTTNFDRVIVILNTVAMMNLEFLDRYENIDAAVWCGGTGQSGTTSLLRMLRGKITPSGKLPDTQVYDFKDDPTFYNIGAQSASHITYAENIYVGYRWWETADAEGYWNGRTRTVDVLRADGTKGTLTKNGYESVVQFPFGYGKSYTEFEWEVTNFTATDTNLAADTKITVDVAVTNVGDRKGKDVVELYVTPPYTDGGIEKSHVVLAAYAKTPTILPGETETVRLEFSAYDIASYDCYDRNGNGFRGYELEAGKYTVSLRTDAHTVKACANSTLEYTAAEGVRFEIDAVGKHKVENRFTREKNGDTTVVAPYADCAIDGSDATGDPITYMSRANFAGTFATHYGNRSGESVSSAASYIYNGYNYTAKPTLGDGSVGALTMYRMANGSALTAAALKSGEGLEINHDLMMDLGGNYDSETWNTLLDQLSYAEMEDLIMLGGYRTKEILSVGKKYFLDNDGGSGLNRHINEGDTNTGYDSSKRSSWTLFPSINLLGASWNNQLAYNYGLALANEGLTTSIDGWYSPSCNMHRSPFCGRVAEYPSEDPLLSGYITAYQAKGALANGMYVYIKHFAVNENEKGRTGLYTWLTEQTLREIYLKPFEITVKVGKATGIMTSFNRLGATWTGGNHALCTEILRDEWGFRGATITDYYAGDGYMPPRQGLYAGQDLLLTGSGTKPGKRFDSNNNNDLNLMRLSSKNILYMKANAYYTAKTHDPKDDIVSSNVGDVLTRKDPFPSWIFIVVGVDVAALAGIAVWCWFIFRNKKKKPLPDGTDGSAVKTENEEDSLFATAAKEEATSTEQSVSEQAESEQAQPAEKEEATQPEQPVTEQTQPAEKEEATSPEESVNQRTKSAEKEEATQPQEPVKERTKSAVKEQAKPAKSKEKKRPTLREEMAALKKEVAEMKEAPSEKSSKSGRGKGNKGGK